MLTQEDVENMVIALPEVTKGYPFGTGVAVYKVADSRQPRADGDEASGKMFALIDEKSKPVRISLKCDPQLAQLLRDKYESVLPGYHLNKKHWNTVLCTGQIPEDELRDLIRHSYELVTATD